MLEKKYQLYMDLMEKHQDGDGFIMFDHCDALLFSSLVGCLPYSYVDVLAARDQKGMWHRRSINKPCWPNHSKSTISRDMFVGLAWYCWRNGRLDISEQVIKYALSHFMKMGKGTGIEGFSRIMMTPSLLATFAWISYRLGGPSRKWLRWIPADTGLSTPEGFAAHLQVLHCLLRSRLTVGTEDYGYILEKHAARQRNNALFAVAAGHLERAERLLKDNKLWPNDRLPRRSDRKSPWLFERDYGDDWKPSNEDVGKEHTGGDFLFAYGLLSGRI